jgi:hypothetical protein
MRKAIRAIIRWLVRQSPFLGYPHEVTIERPAQTMNRHERECQDYLRMMERQRRYRIDIDGLDE